MSKQLVYFIQSVNGGPIKIGKTSEERLFIRLTSIQIGNPEELIIIGITYNFSEKDLHEKFVKERIRGEWFSPSGELLNLIKNNCSSYEIQKYREKNHNIYINENCHIGRSNWTQDEIDLVIKYYPSEESLDYLLGLLPGRTLKSIRHVASGLRIRRKQKSSLFKGVYWHKKQKQWNVIINKDGKRLNLGSFDKEEDANNAYQDYIKNHQIT